MSDPGKGDRLSSRLPAKVKQSKAYISPRLGAMPGPAQSRDMAPLPSKARRTGPTAAKRGR